MPQKWMLRNLERSWNFYPYLLYVGRERKVIICMSSYKATMRSCLSRHTRLKAVPKVEDRVEAKATNGVAESTGDLSP